MKQETRGIMTNAIIARMNEQVKKENVRLSEQKQFQRQKPLHGMDLFLQMANLDDYAIQSLAAACGV